MAGTKRGKAAGGNGQAGAKPRHIILDTDLNEDCDDAGALAVLHALADEGKAEILGISYCTSSRWGPPCIDVINRWYGRPSLPLGTLRADGFLDEYAHLSYPRYVAEAYGSRVERGDLPAAVTLLRRLLAAREARDVTFVAIGPLVNLADLLDSGPDDASPLSGRDLVAASVERLVLMAGSIPEGREYNVVSHPVAARAVLAIWPTRIDIIDGKFGGSIWTGAELQYVTPQGNPVRSAYKYHSGGLNNASYDLLAVDWAVTRSRGFYGLSSPGRMEVDEFGNDRWVDDPKGRCRYLVGRKREDFLEARIDGLLCRPPAHPGRLSEVDDEAVFSRRREELSRHMQKIVDDNLEELEPLD
jgi:hypothetical protein